MEELIKFLEEQLTLKPSDLIMKDDDRMILVGQIALLDQIKEIHENGYPTDEEKD
jgi:hypothetical protein